MEESKTQKEEECLRAVVKGDEPLMLDIVFLRSKGYVRNPELVRESVRRFAAALRAADAPPSMKTAAHA